MSIYKTDNQTIQTLPFASDFRRTKYIKKICLIQVLMRNMREISRLTKFQNDSTICAAVQYVYYKHALLISYKSTKIFLVDIQVRELYDIT